MARIKGQSITTIEITKGDRLRGPSAEMQDADTKQAINLAASTVAFRMVEIADSSNVVVDSAAANIDDAANGLVSYDFVANDVDTAGTFAAWWIRTEGGLTEHYPSGDDYITVIIAESY